MAHHTGKPAAQRKQHCTLPVAALLTAGSLLLAGALTGFAAPQANGRQHAPRPAELYRTLAAGQSSSRASGLAGFTVDLTPRSRDVQVATSAGIAWLPFLPQGCEDDYECNDGKANFPLQCCELPLLGGFCCEPGELAPPPQNPAYVPLPVPVEK